MNVTLTGATGFLGQRLLASLVDGGHKVWTLGRKRPQSAPSSVQFSEWNAEAEPPPESLAHADAVIHLAGEPVAQRWTAEVKQRIRSSRVDGTRHLVNALAKQSRHPEVLVCGSAIGIYGSRGDEILTEASTPGSDFLAQVCVDWEQAALAAESLGVRVVLLRTGVVLGHGGALPKMLPPFRLGVGGRIGDGRQWMSWIHIEDEIRLILYAMERREVRGPVNATAPNPVTNEEFTRELASVLHRPAIFPVPAIALKLLFGEMAEVVLASQRVLPQSAPAAGFEFKYPELRPALRQILPDH
jgi:uncharacterized protein (TIGR01777 family)